MTAVPDTRPVVICGPSGVGKGTLIDMLFAAHPTRLARTVSHTTRAPRPGERPGSTYHFVSEPEFTALKLGDAFAEYTQYNGSYYGTTTATIDEQTAKGRIVILEIDIDGADQIKEREILDARYVFICPVSLLNLEESLRSRGTETEESLRKRLANAEKEIEQMVRSPGLFNKLIINDILTAAYRELEKYVLGE